MFDANYSTDLMITHFHKDHFNGVLNISDNKAFQNVYLPFCILDEGEVYSGALSRLITIASPRSWGFNLSKQIITLFEKLELLVIDINNIKFLKKGDMISIGDKKVDILWPKVDFHLDDISVEYAFIGLGELPGYWQTIDGELSFRDFNERLIRQYEQLMTSEEYGIKTETASKIIEGVNRLSNSINSFLNSLHNRDFANQDYVKLINDLKDAKEFSLEINKSLWDKTGGGLIYENEVLKDGLKTFGRNQYHELVKSMNALSIVFHNKGGEFLFLGDASPKVIEYIDSEKLFKETYKVVKVQHHGTDKHFSQFIPKGNNYIISNGGYHWRKVSERNITMFERRDVSDTAKVYCTNAHENPEKFCEYFIENNNCSPICLKMNSIETIEI